MDLNWSESDLAFRDEVRAFLDASLDDDLRAAGRLMTSVYGEHAATMRWHRILADKGWAAPAWPVEYGGCGWSGTISQRCKRRSQMPPVPRNSSRSIGATAKSKMSLVR